MCAHLLLALKPLALSFMVSQSEELIKRGVALEEAGRLIEACKLYEKVLASEPGNLELRQYVGSLVTQINMRISEDSRRARAEETMGPGVSGRPGRPSSGSRPGTAPSASLFSGGDSGRIRGGSSSNRADGGVATPVSNNSLIYQMRSGAHEINPTFRSTSGEPYRISICSHVHPFRHMPESEHLGAKPMQKCFVL